MIELQNCELVLRKVFLIEDSNVYLLCGALNELMSQLRRFGKPCANRDRLVRLLVELLRSEPIFLAVFCVDLDRSEESKLHDDDSQGTSTGGNVKIEEENSGESSLESETYPSFGGKTDAADFDLDVTLNELIQLLSSLSTEVSNILQLDLPPFFAHLNVEKSILVHILNSVRMSWELHKANLSGYPEMKREGVVTNDLSAELGRVNISCDSSQKCVIRNKVSTEKTLLWSSYLASHLFNKLLANFTLNSCQTNKEHAQFISKMLRLFQLWIQNDCDNFFKARLHSLFEPLSHRSLEILVTNLVNSVDDPTVCERLCERFLSSKHYEYVIGVKLVFQAHWSVLDKDTDRIVRNLVHLLASLSDWQLTNRKECSQNDAKSSIESKEEVNRTVQTSYNKGKGNVAEKTPRRYDGDRDKSNGDGKITRDEIPGESFFCQVLTSVLQLWSNYQVLVHSNIQQHAYLSKILINMVALQPVLVKTSDKYLLNGIMAHLKCTNEVLRTIGMITGDRILAFVHEAEEADESEKVEDDREKENSSRGVAKPKTIGFDYDKVSPEAKAYVENLRKIIVKKQDEEDGASKKADESAQKSDTESNDDIDGVRGGHGETDLKEADEILLGLLTEFSIVPTEGATKQRKEESKDKPRIAKQKDGRNAQEKNDLTNKTDLNSKENVNIGTNVKVDDSDDDASSENSFLLDSDDEDYAELETDATHVVHNQASSKVSKYLRDLKDYLTQDRSKDGGAENGADIWTQTLRNAEGIIREQLPLDDVHIGLDLINVFVTLDKEYYFEDFETVRLNAILAVVLVYPKQAAEHLCSQFHQFGHVYSVRQKMMILDALAHGAHLLSSLEQEGKDREVGHSSSDKSGIVSNGKGVFKKGSACDKSSPTSPEQIETAQSQLKQEILGTLIWRSRKLDQPATDALHGPGGVKLKANHFASVVPWFFYPLIRGKSTKEDVFIPLTPREDGLNLEMGMREEDARKRREDNLKLLEEIESSLSVENSVESMLRKTGGAASIQPYGKSISNIVDRKKTVGKTSSPGGVFEGIRESLELNTARETRELSRKLDELVIIRLVRTLSVIMLASQNSIHNVAMATEMLEFLRALSQDGCGQRSSVELEISLLAASAAVLISVSKSRIREFDLSWLGKWSMRLLSESCELRVREMSRRVLALYVAACEEVNVNL